MARLRPDEIKESHVKDWVKDWYKARNAWHYAPIQNGMGEHGIPDRIGCVPIVVTREMVGTTIGLFVAIESKKPGRRGEERRGASPHQRDNLIGITEAGGIGVVVDGHADLNATLAKIDALVNNGHRSRPQEELLDG